MSIGALLFSFQGRINRKPYWLAGLAATVLMALILIFASSVMVAGGGGVGIGGLALLVLVLSVPFIWVGLALGAKRLHDRNRSAWWLLIFYLLPGILDAAGQMWVVFRLAGAVVSLWGLIELGFLRGTSGPNAYGPDPMVGAPEPVSAAEQAALHEG